VNDRPLDRNPWWVGTLCGLALLVTWVCYFAVYNVLPAQTPAAHWGLLVLALGSTLGLILVFERAFKPWVSRRRAELDEQRREVA
jgi:hypothetical protein